MGKPGIIEIIFKKSNRFGSTEQSFSDGICIFKEVQKYKDAATSKLTSFCLIVN